MQFAKDSFYMALRERLMSLNPQRTVTLNGVTRPAVVVAENEQVIPVEPQPDTFYLEWRGSQIKEQGAIGRALMEMGCVISYHTFGAVESGVDRGRVMGALDVELLSICHPPRTNKRDYSQGPSAGLGTNIAWTAPKLGEVSGVVAGEGSKAKVRLERRAQLSVFFFPEVDIQ